MSLRDSRALSWLSGSRTDVPAETPHIGPDCAISATANNKSKFHSRKHVRHQSRKLIIHQRTSKMKFAGRFS